MASCDTENFYDGQSGRPKTETVFHVFINPLYSLEEKSLNTTLRVSYR